MEEKILEVKNLKVVRDKEEIIEHLSFDVLRGRIIAILGPNGAGKTTLFRALLGLIPYEGIIKWAKDVKIGYVPQRLAIDRFLPLSVLELFKLKTKNIDDIYFALESVGFPKDEHHLRHHLLKKRIGVLSGGELQKVLIAWALVDHPDVLLFDEPTAGVDIAGEETIYNLLYRLEQEKKLTIIFISHDLNVVTKYADTVLCLNKEMVCYGAPLKALTEKTIEQLYGGGASLFPHEHKATHD